ncbi:MAG: hypothetical protein ACK45U_01680, partial [bacterium]
MKTRLTIILLLLIAFTVNAQQVSLIKDVYTGSSSSNPEYFYKASDNKIYFFAINPATFNRALYIT